MEINSETFPDLTPQNLAYVFAHEAGHFLGLDHSPVASALMFATYALDSSAGPPALGPDDIAGICTAYPPTRAPAASCNFEPVRGFAPDCGGNVVGGCAVAAAPAPTAWGAAGGLSALALAAVSLALGARSRLIRHRRAGRRRPARAPGQSPPSPPPL
jgi:hypothetical protein